MTIPWHLLKNLSHPAVATVSGGSGAVIMYFCKPETTWEEKETEWKGKLSAEKQKTEQSELLRKKQRQEFNEQLKNPAENDRIRVAVNAYLIDTKKNVKAYGECILNYSKERITIANNSWTSQGLPTDAQFESKCPAPKLEDYSG